MKKKEEIVKSICDICNNLFDSGIISEKVDIDEQTVLMGANSVFDSIAFVTLFMDLEEKMSDSKGEEVYLLIDEIHEYNPEDTFLTVGTLADYIENLSK
ncbi:MAG TPA: hypothetical protein VFD03_11795 [Clostridia bacterium]|nr:hypothetical protein [Clostridia bacterium]